MHFSKLFSATVLSGTLFLAGSCTLFKKNTQNAPLLMPEIEVASDDQATMYRATATKEWELVHTDIDISFNLKERSAEAVTQLSMHPYYYSTDSVVLDAKSMVIAEVTDGNNQKLSYRYDTLKLNIKLPGVYAQNDTLKLKIKYTALPYALAAGGGSAITEDRGLYFINTDGYEPYQQVQVWTQGETEASSHWFPTFDRNNFRSPYRITMHVPDSFKTLSNGILVSSVKEKGNMRSDTWQQNLPIPSYLVMMAMSNFAITRDSWHGKEVSYYVPQEYGAYAKDIFNHTPEMIDFFSNKLGVAFPWDKYSQVVVYDYVSGAMENVSASLFGAFNLKDKRQLNDDRNDYIIAHELFHQWFGDYVTAESWSNLTLNESFADYSEHLWSEYKYGDDARAEVWRQGLAKYIGQAKYNDPELVRFHYHTADDMFDRVSYSKGGLILHYLRQLTGDKAFFDALHLYLTQNALHSAEATQLRLAFEQVTGKDWNWFFNQWYYRGGHPELEVSYAYDDAAQSVTVTVLQKQADSIGLYRLPMKAQIISGSTSKEVWWNVEKAKEEFVYPYSNNQRPVIVPDAGHWIPGVITDKKSAGQWFTQFKYSNDHLSKRFALTGAEEYDNNDTAQQLFELALKDKDPVLRNLAIQVKPYESKKAIAKTWVGIIGKMAVNDPDNKTRANALLALGTMRNEEYISTYESSINDSSYMVASSALYALDRVNHKRAVEYAYKLNPTDMKGNVLLYRASEVIATDGKKEDFHFFEQKTWQLFESNRAFFLNTVQTYLIHVDDISTFTKGIKLLEKLAAKSPDAAGSFYAAVIMYNVRSYAEKNIKIATDKELIDNWKLKRDIATSGWESYKTSIKTESRKLDVSRMEKEEE